MSFAFSCFGQGTSNRNKVRSESDLPRYTYVVHGPVADLLQSPPSTFDEFAAKVGGDLQSILASYDVEDKSTQRQLLDAKLSIEELNGKNQDALNTIATIRSLEEKPDARLMQDIVDEAIIRARLDTGDSEGPAYQRAFARRFGQSVNALPWAVVQERMKQLKGGSEVLSAAFLMGVAKSDIQPMATRSGSVDNQAAWTLLEMRRAVLYAVPLKSEIVSVIDPYIRSHSLEKPDIWQAREVDVSGAQNLHPVLVGIWDSGVDTTVFQHQLYTDPDPDWHDPHGLAFDDQGGPSKSLLLPLTAEQQQEYPKFIDVLKGMEDQRSAVDSPEAESFRKMLASAPPDQVRTIIDKLKLYGPYIHGTHVAGIAVRGDPAARLVVLRFNDQLPDLPFAPTPEWAHRMADNFRKIGEYCRTHHVRVVNMSWGDEPVEFETWLSKTGKGQDAATRKEQAMQLFDIWKAGISDAIEAAPETLFICAAGNSNSNPGFIEDVPPSLRLPNLIAVGAVDQAGDETSFTSHGATVVVDANGYNVESYLPGGARMKLSGTSMASPNVTNLAAKLIAIQPSLSPAQVIALIKDGATTSNGGRAHLIDGKRSVALLSKQDKQ